MEFGGISEFIESHDKVLIKPSMLEGMKKEIAVTTHPSVVSEIPL